MSRDLPGYSNCFKRFGSKELPSLDPTRNYPHTIRRALEYKEFYKGYLSKIFGQLQYPYRMENLIFIQDKELRSELRRFLLCLDAYLETPDSVMSAKTILALATEKTGAKTLKRIKMKAVLAMFDTNTFEPNNDIKDLPEYKINDIGQIFNYTYLPFWKEDDEEDYKYGYLPVNVDKTYLKRFRKKIRNLLPDMEFQEKDYREFILGSSGSSKLKENLETTKTFLAASTFRYPAKSIGICKRAIVPVKPEGYRDTVITQFEPFVRIAWIDSQMRQILRKIEGHIHLTNRDMIERRLNRFSKRYSFFLMRDIKKEGITKPRILLQVMLEELNKKYPNLKAFEYPDFYNDFQLLNNKNIEKPIRGHGLGMANSLTTLMNIAIFHMTMDEEEFEIIDDEAECLALNDDFTAGFKTQEDLDSYADKEMLVMEKLSLIYSPNKSFSSSRGFVIAEEYFYFNSRSKKESYFRAEILKSLSCINIVHAKALINSCVNMENIHIWENYKREIITFWGYEFFPHEYCYPYSCGGWITDQINGVRLDLQNLDELEFKSYVYKAFKACCIPFPKVRKKSSKKIYDTPLKLFGNLSISKTLRGYLDIGTIEDMYSKYLRSKDFPIIYEKTWESFKMKRLQTFKKSVGYTFDHFIIEFKQFYNDCDFLPLPNQIERWVRIDLMNAEINDHYYSPTPLLSAIKYENSDFRADIGEQYSLFTREEGSSFNFNAGNYFINNDVILKAFNKFREKRYFKMYPIFRDRNDDFDFQRSFIHPVKVAQAYSGLNYVEVPILKTEFRSPLTKQKEMIYGSFIPFEHRRMIEQNFDNRLLIKEILPLCLEYGVSEISEIIAEIKAAERPYKASAPDDEYDEEEREFRNQVERISDPDQIDYELLDEVAYNNAISPTYYPSYMRISAALKSAASTKSFRTAESLISSRRLTRDDPGLQEKAVVDLRTTGIIFNLNEAEFLAFNRQWEVYQTLAAADSQSDSTEEGFLSFM